MRQRGLAVVVMLTVLAAVSGVAEDTLTNADVIALVKAGLGANVVIAKIRSTTVEFDTSASALQELKANSVPDEVVLAMIEAVAKPKGEVTENRPQRLRDELSTSFQKLQNAVVTVWSEFGHGTGFFVDDKGLVLTNQHVVGPSEYLAVQ